MYNNYLFYPLAPVSPKLHQEYKSEKTKISLQIDGNVRSNRSTVIENESKCVTLERINNAIIRFLVDDLQPFNRTESKSFQNLLAGNF